MITLDEVKKRLEPWFKDRGFISNSGQRLWFEDNGFYLTVAEIQPIIGRGFILNMGVSFLWNDSFSGGYDYSFGDIGVYVPNALFGAVSFDSPAFENDLCFVLEECNKRIRFYRELKQLDTLDERLNNRNDNAVLVNKDFKKWDKSHAITRMLLGDTETATQILTNDISRYNEYISANFIGQDDIIKEKCDDFISKRLLDCIDNRDDFKKLLIDIINNCRRDFSIKKRLKLNDIDSLFND